MSASDSTHLRRLMRWILISLGIHAALLLVTSIGWLIGLFSPPAPAEPAKPAQAAAPAAKPPATTEQPAPPTGALPPVPKATDADAAYFGKPETDPKKLQEGPDARPDLDALK